MPTSMTVARDSDAHDRALVARCHDRDVQAMRELFDRHAATVHGCAVAITYRAPHLSADDLTVAAFVALWQDPSSAVADRRTIRAQLLVSVGRRRGDVCLVA